MGMTDVADKFAAAKIAEQSRENLKSD